MAAAKSHGTGTRGRHRRKEVKDLLEHKRKQDERLLKQFLRNQKKKNKRLTQIVRTISTPEVLKAWANYQRLSAKKQLGERKIRQFTYYCKLLAIDALYEKHLPKKNMKVQRGIVFRPSKEGILSETQKRDILERLGEMETRLFNRKDVIKRQTEKLSKTLPKVA